MKRGKVLDAKYHTENAYKLACRAALWYNAEVIFGCHRGTGHTRWRDERKVTSLMEDSISLWSKKCIVCGQIKYFEEFSPGNELYGTSNRCKECKNARTREIRIRIPSDQKKCAVCKEVKSIDDFSKDSHGAKERQGTCIICMKKRRKEAYIPRPRKAVIRKTPDFKICKRCEQTKPKESFSPHRGSRDLLHAWCKPCSAEYRRTQPQPSLETIRANYLKREYNLTVEEYQAKFDAQDGVCAICKRPEKLFDKRANRLRHLAVDHDHETGQVRDLLCASCNQAFGNMEENPDLIRALLEYGKKWKGGQEPF